MWDRHVGRQIGVCEQGLRNRTGPLTVTKPMTSRQPRKFKDVTWIYFRVHHRLNGSSSHVLTATSHSYGKAKNSTPHRIETPNLIEIKFGTVDYVGEATPSAKFHAYPSMGASRQMGEIYTKNFYLYIPFFRNSPTARSDPSADFSARWLKRRGLTQGCAFWGLKKSELIFDPWKIPPKSKFGQKLDLKNFRQKRPCIKFSSVNSP